MNDLSYYFFDDKFSNFLDRFTSSIFNTIKLSSGETPLHKIIDYSTAEKLWMGKYDIDPINYLDHSISNLYSRIYYIGEDYKGDTYKSQILRYGYNDANGQRTLIYSMFINSECTIWDLVMIMTLEYTNIFLNTEYNISLADVVNHKPESFSEYANIISFYTRLIEYMDSILNFSYNDYEDFYNNFTNILLNDARCCTFGDVLNKESFEVIYRYAITKDTTIQDYEDLINYFVN